MRSYHLTNQFFHCLWKSYWSSSQDLLYDAIPSPLCLKSVPKQKSVWCRKCPVIIYYVKSCPILHHFMHVRVLKIKSQQTILLQIIFSIMYSNCMYDRDGHTCLICLKLFLPPKFYWLTEDSYKGGYYGWYNLNLLNYYKEKYPTWTHKNTCHKKLQTPNFF